MMKPKKIILIVIDTLRADHLGCYGYKRNTSPNIDKFAKEGLFFKWTFAPVSYTVPSITSIFTGKYPSNHCTMFSNAAPVKSRDNDVFLAEILSSEGYDTAAFVSGLVITRAAKVAITAGFRTYNDKMTSPELNRSYELIRSGEETNEEVFKWLEKNYKNDFFLFIHYFDVHGPYVNPKHYDEIFVNDEYYGEPKFIDKIVPEYKALGGIPDYQVLSPKRDEEKNLIDFEKDIRYYIAQYDGGIRYCDEQVGNLFKKLGELGIHDECLIILTSDHGEALGENNVYFYHGLTVTMDQIHVPLIIKPHSDWRPNAYLRSTPVSLVDIMPTILELVGFDVSELEIEGDSILDIDKDTNRKMISEIEPQIAHIDKNFIHLKPRDTLDEKRYFPYITELCDEEKQFNYKKDPECLNNLWEFEWTGERYLPFVDPKICGAEIHYEHLHRYHFASHFVTDKKVLDLASGEGYGGYMLSQEANQVIGIELDKKTVKHASSRYIRDNLEFIPGSILKVPIEMKTFEVIICFEALEHVKEHEKLMKEVKRLLKDDGIFIVSMPDKKSHSDDITYNNPFHKKELYFDDFKELMQTNFNHVCFFGQRVYAGSHLWSLTQVNEISEEYVIEGRRRGFAITDYKKKKPIYFIAIASDKEVDVSKIALRSYLTDVDNTVFDNFRDHIECIKREKESIEREKNTQIAQLQEEINKMHQLKSVRLHRNVEGVLRKLGILR